MLALFEVGSMRHTFGWVAGVWVGCGFPLGPSAGKGALRAGKGAPAGKGGGGPVPTPQGPWSLRGAPRAGRRWRALAAGGGR